MLLAIIAAFTVHSFDVYAHTQPSDRSLLSLSHFPHATLAIPDFSNDDGIKLVGKAHARDYRNPFSTEYPRQADFIWIKDGLVERQYALSLTTQHNWRDLTTASEMRAFIISAGTNHQWGIMSAPTGSDRFYVLPRWYTDLNHSETDSSWNPSNSLCLAINGFGGNHQLLKIETPFHPSLTNHQWITKDAFQSLANALDQTRTITERFYPDLPGRAFYSDYRLAHDTTESKSRKWTTNIGSHDWKYETTNETYTSTSYTGRYIGYWYKSKSDYQTGYVEAGISYWSDWCYDYESTLQTPRQTESTCPSGCSTYLLMHPISRQNSIGFCKIITVYEVSQNFYYEGKPHTLLKYVAHMGTVSGIIPDGTITYEYPSIQSIAEAAGLEWCRDPVQDDGEHSRYGTIQQTVSIHSEIGLIKLQNSNY